MSFAGSVTIEAKGLERLLAQFPQKTKKAIAVSLDQAGLIVRNTAKENAPYLTGNLRRSITHKVLKGTVAEVGTDVIYARMREFNTRRLPNGYLRPALSKNKSKIMQIFERNLNKVTKS